MNDLFDLRVCTCAECNKEFECSSLNLYKVHKIDGTRRFCSYKCYNTFIKRQEQKWLERHKKDFEDIPEKKKVISLYTAYRYARRSQRAEMGFDL